jgi:hypothetical protein
MLKPALRKGAEISILFKNSLRRFKLYYLYKVAGSTYISMQWIYGLGPFRFLGLQELIREWRHPQVKECMLQSLST